MSEMSDLFDSLDASDLDEIAGKLNVAPKKEVQIEPIVEETQAPVEQKKERKYVKFESLNEQVQELFDNSEIFPESITPRPKPQPRAPQQKPRQSFVESAAKALSHQVKNTPKYETKPLRETVSVEERIKLLEQDLFRVQAQATPNTLVAGIGASLDSGGGAVWLWDLEDVNIGVPLNGTYPSITNGASLVYKSGTGKWEPTVISGGSGGTITTDQVFLANPVTLTALQAGLQTLPDPGTDVDTQDDANQWFKLSLLDIDERLGGVDGNTDVPGNLDFEDTDNVASIRRFNATVPTLQIEIGNTVASLEATTEFLKGSTTSFVPFSVSPAASNTVAGTVDLLSIGKTNQDSSQVKVFNVSIDETEVLNKATFVRPSGGGISGFNIQGTLEGNVATNSNLFYVDQASDATAGGDAIKYYGVISDENDIVTKKYVDSSTGGSTAGVTKIIAGSNVSISPESGIGEVTIDATGSGSGGWSLTGDTALTGACDIELTASNNALRFLNTSNGVMMRLMDNDNTVEFNSLADFNQGLELASGKDITLAGPSTLVMKDGQGTAFELSDDGGNVFLRANTAGSEGLIFYKDLSDTNSATRVKFRAYEPPGGSHFYLTTGDTDSLDFVDKTTDEIYLRFNTGTKKLQIADTDIELNVAGVTNTGSLETPTWNVGDGTAASGKIIINDNDVDSFDIENEAFPNAPHIRFRTNTDDQASVFFQPLWIGSNKEVLLDPTGSGTATFNCLATFASDVTFASASNESINFGAADGSSARSMVVFNRRLASTAGQIDFSIKGYRPGENTVKDVFTKKDNNPATEGDEILYYGETDNDEYAIQTKKSVNALIGSGGGGISFTFKGTTDVTAADPPAGAAAGDYYLNSVSGNAGANWSPIAGLAVALNQIVIYKADGNWATGGGAAAFLPLTGGTVTGATTFEDALTAEGVVSLQGEATSTAGIVVDRTSAPNNILDIKQAGTRTAQIVANGNAQFAALSSTGTMTVANTGDTNALIIKDGSTTTAQIFKGGAATFTGAVTGSAFKLTDNSKFTVATTGATTVASLTSNGAVVAGTTLGVTGAFTANGTSKFKDTITVDVSAPLTVNSQSRFNTYTVIMEGGFSSGILGTGSDCSINGDLTIEDPSASGFSGAIILKEASGAEKANLSAAQLATQTRVTFNGSQVNQAIRAEGNAAKTLTFAVSNTTGGNAADNTFASTLIMGKNLITFPRNGGNNTNAIVFKGTTLDDTSDTDQTLLGVYRNTAGGANPDAINYYGRTAGAENLQTKTSVDALIAAAGGGGANLLSGGTIKKTGGSVSTSGNLAVEATSGGGGSLFIRNTSGNDIHSLNANGTAVFGSAIEIGSANSNNSSKVINLLGSSQPSLSLTTQAISGSVQEIVNFANNQTFFQTALKVGPVGGSSNYLLTTDGTVQTDGALKLTGSQTQTTAGTPAVSSDSNLIYFNTSQTGKAFFVKTGGVNSSSQPNNHMIFYCGSTSTTSNVGIRNPILTLGNQNGTYVASLGAPNAVSSIRQQYENEIVIMKTLSTTSLAVTSSTITTATETDSEGETRNIITQTAATVPGNVTFSGNNIHSGTVTHNADFTVGTNHIITLNSSIFMSNGDYNFSSTSGSHTTQKIRNKGQANKALMITATDGSNAEQNILSLANAGSEFFRPITVPTPTADAHAATKAYVDSHTNNISGGQQSGTFTATFDGPFAPSTKQTAAGHYRKYGDLTHVTIHATNLNLTNYASEIRITGLPFKPDPDIAGGNHIGKIHGVSFMVNNAHGDDGFVAVATHNATYGNHIVVYSEQVDQVTHYLNASPAKVTISITYIAE